LLITQCHLMIREGRAAAGTVRYDFEALIEQAFIPDGFEKPPDGFDVFIVIRDIGFFKIDPIGNTLGQAFPVLNTLKSGFLAEGIEFLNPIFIDLAFVGEFEFFLNLDLDWQPVGIPTAAPINKKALHRLVAWKHIFEDTCEDMVNTWFAISGWGTFINHIPGTCLALVHGFLENVMRAPKTQHGLFHDIDIQS